MSARVLNPALLSEFCRMRSPVRSSVAAACGAQSRPKVKRDLFGSVEKNEFKKFFDAEIGKHQQRASERWGFNFAAGHPLANTDQHQHRSPYKWERVPAPSSHASPAAAPQHMFTLSSAAHLRPICPRSPRKSQSRAAEADRFTRDNLLLNERVRLAAAACCVHPADVNAAGQTTTGAHNRSPPLNSSAEYSATEEDEAEENETLNSSTSSNSSSLNESLGHPATTLSLVITATTTTAASSSSTSSAAAAPSKPTLRASTRRQRQPRITDYLKERKRLSATPKKVSPSKRTRLNSSLSRVA